MRLIEAVVWLARRRLPITTRRLTFPMPALDLPAPAAEERLLEPPPLASFGGLPTRGRVGSKFGKRFHPILHKHKLHAGVDIAAPTGTPVWATSAGVVSFAGAMRGYGNTVIIDHPGRRQTLYAHLSVIGVRRGRSVARGQQIGAVGQTGLATGPHLHYEVRREGKPIDPGIG